MGRGIIRFYLVGIAIILFSIAIVFRLVQIQTDPVFHEISEKVGYDNEFFFYRLFRKYTGKTPSEFRKSSHLGI